MHFGPEDAAPRLNVGRVEMHLSGRGTPPSGLYLAERKKPKNLYHLGSKGKEDGEGFLIQGTVTFFVRIPLREKPLRFWSSCQRVFIRLFGIDTIFPLAISFEEKERFLVLWIFSLELLLVPFLLGNFFRREDEGEMMDILISSILKRETVYSQDVDARKDASSRYNCREYGWYGREF